MIELNPDQKLEYYESRSVTRALLLLKGVVSRSLEPVSTEEMDRAVAEQVVESFRPSGEIIASDWGFISPL